MLFSLRGLWSTVWRVWTWRLRDWALKCNKFNTYFHIYSYLCLLSTCYNQFSWIRVRWPRIDDGRQSWVSGYIYMNDISTMLLGFFEHFQVRSFQHHVVTDNSVPPLNWKFNSSSVTFCERFIFQVCLEKVFLFASLHHLWYRESQLSVCVQIVTWMDGP